MSSTITSDDDKLLKFGTAKKMFAAFKEATPSIDPNASPLVFDKQTGRYTNESVVAWMDTFADGLIYGIKFPKWDYSQSTDAIKTGANAGLVLNPSDERTIGRNDYLNKKLFFCPRVNGGVDPTGMPYITSIEGMDDRFSCTEQNTWALTPVYYVKYSAEENYWIHEYSDAHLEGFDPCPGAFCAGGVMRPYILRACYVASKDNQFASTHALNSKSGRIPAKSSIKTADFACAPLGAITAQRTAKKENTGLTYACYQDFTYQIEFMQLMLGTKAPIQKRYGTSNICRGLGTTVYKYDPSKPNILTTITTDINYWKQFWHSSREICIEPGHPMYAIYNTYVPGRADSEYPSHITYLGITTNIQQNSQNHIEYTFDRKISLPDNIINDGVVSISTYEWGHVTGLCDNVLGTYGARKLEYELKGWEPFKFQNIEYMYGQYENIVNLFHDPFKGWVYMPDFANPKSILSNLLGRFEDQKYGEGYIVFGQYGMPYIRDAWIGEMKEPPDKGFKCMSRDGGSGSTGYATSIYFSERDYLTCIAYGSPAMEGQGYNPPCKGIGSIFSDSNYRIVDPTRSDGVDPVDNNSVFTRISALGRCEE